MTDKPRVVKKTESKPEETPQKSSAGVSRRDFLVGTGTGVAGLVVGGLVGYQVIPQPEKPAPPLPELWIGRNVASQSCMGCRLCEVACSQAKEQKIQPSIARVYVPQYVPGIEFPVLCYQFHQNQALTHTTSAHQLFDLGCNVDERMRRRCIHPQIFGQRLHSTCSPGSLNPKRRRTSARFCTSTISRS